MKLYRPYQQRSRVSGGSEWELGPPPDVLLPYTENTADNNTFVCQMTGAANSHEVGVGGGVTGADLVLSLYGSCNAASGGFKYFPNAASSCYYTTSALRDALWNDRSTGSMFVQVHSISKPGSGYNYYGYTNSNQLYTEFRRASSDARVFTTKIGSSDVSIIWTLDKRVSARTKEDGSGVPFWWGCSWSGCIACFGIKFGNEPPKNCYDFSEGYLILGMTQLELPSLVTYATENGHSSNPAYHSCGGVGSTNSSYNGTAYKGTVILSNQSIGFPEGHENLISLGLVEDWGAV